mgnify:CR=1 FL=1
MVRSFARVYGSRLRDWFSEALARGGRYIPVIREVFAAEGLPEELAYVALVESAFKPFSQFGLALTESSEQRVNRRTHPE